MWFHPKHFLTNFYFSVSFSVFICNAWGNSLITLLLEDTILTSSKYCCSLELRKTFWIAAYIFFKNIKRTRNGFSGSIQRFNINVQGFSSSSSSTRVILTLQLLYSKCCLLETHEKTRKTWKHVLTTGCCQFVVNYNIFLKGKWRWLVNSRTRC